MSDIHIERFKHQDKQTLGWLTAEGKTFACLELAWKDNDNQVSCIPPGSYPYVKQKNHPKFGQVLRLEGVPARAGVLVHSGNYFTHSLGCVLVGQSHLDINKDGYLDVTGSKAAIAALIESVADKGTIHVHGVAGHNYDWKDERTGGQVDQVAPTQAAPKKGKSK